jgi:RpiB/LacA/LacB family sugar-phosphate isomerase
MKLAIGSDHAGFALKNTLAALLRGEGHTLLEVGSKDYDPNDDYPDAAAAVGRAVAQGQAERGLLICGSGVGASVAANKIRGVRAGLCHDTYSARQGVEHDDVNVLCLGARVIGEATAHELAGAFVGARFSGDERHLRRLRKTLALETSG